MVVRLCQVVSHPGADPTDQGWVVCGQPIAVELDEVGRQTLDVVE
jgi:hypothetical protein